MKGFRRMHRAHTHVSNLRATRKKTEATVARKAKRRSREEIDAERRQKELSRAGKLAGLKRPMTEDEYQKDEERRARESIQVSMDAPFLSEAHRRAVVNEFLSNL